MGPLPRDKLVLDHLPQAGLGAVDGGAVSVSAGTTSADGSAGGSVAISAGTGSGAVGGRGGGDSFTAVMGPHPTVGMLPSRVGLG